AHSWVENTATNNKNPKMVKCFCTLFFLNRDQPVLCLPFLVRTLATIRCQELPIIVRCRGELFQMVVRSCAQKIGARRFWQKVGTSVESTNSRAKVLVFRRGDSQVSISFLQRWLQRDGAHQLILCRRKLLLLHEHKPIPVVPLSIIRSDPR